MKRSPHHPRRARLREVLRRFREERALTQAALAQRLGRPQSFVSKIERGERHLDLVELEDVCRGLDLDLQEVLAALGFEGIPQATDAGSRSWPEGVAESVVPYGHPSPSGSSPAPVLEIHSGSAWQGTGEVPGIPPAATDRHQITAAERVALAGWARQLESSAGWLGALVAVLLLEGATPPCRSPPLLPEHARALADALDSVPGEGPRRPALAPAVAAFLRRAADAGDVVQAVLRSPGAP